MNTSAPQPSLAFTSRDLLLGVGIVAVLLGAYLAFWTYCAAPLALCIAIAVGRVGKRSNARAYIVVARVLLWTALLLCGLLLLANLTGHGPVWQRDRWPPAIARIATAAESDMRGVRVYCHFVDMLDAKFVWRQHISHDKLPLVVESFDLEESFAPPPEWSLHSFPGWWRPVERNGNRYFTTYFGKNYTIMMYDPASEWLYVWHYWDF